MQVRFAPRSRQVERPRYTLPETMILTWVFLAIGFALGLIALFWLRRTGQLRLW